MNIEDMTLVKLREIAKEQGIKSISKYKKAELIQLIKDVEKLAPKVETEEPVKRESSQPEPL